MGGSAKAPLKGELSAKLTEGFRFGFSQTLQKANYRVLYISGPLFRFQRRLFKEKPEPLSLANASQLPFQGSP